MPYSDWVTVCSHVLTERQPKNVTKLKEDVQDWMKKQKVLIISS